MISNMIIMLCCFCELGSLKSKNTKSGEYSRDQNAMFSVSPFQNYLFSLITDLSVSFL